MACTYDLAVDGCFLQITEQPSGELKYQLALGSLTFTQRNGVVVNTRDGLGNTFSANIDDINGYADIPTLFTFLDAQRDLCAPATGGGTPPPTPTEVTGTYGRSAVTGAGTTTADILGLVVTNIGGSSGTFGGATLAAGQTEIINKTFNEATGEVVLVPAIAYDATGTTFTIAEFNA